jgi:lipopolysaccharide/colanic/teichoic acid biosynthesis glycosyltransferase
MSRFALGGFMLKRSVDIALAGLLFAVTLPILAIAAIVIKLDSEGPVFFVQARMGRGFKSFQLLKLRTMRPSGAGPAYTLGVDPRITRVGRWLRWLKFDELPQLLNVLRGDMSMVGPRPVIPELTVEFRREYERLLEVRPGLTDPATIKYCRETELLALVPEPLKYFKTVVTPDKLRISQEYLEKASVWSDFGVMVGTAVALCPARWRSRIRRQVPARQDKRETSVEENNGLCNEMATNRLG